VLLGGAASLLPERGKRAARPYQKRSENAPVQRGKKGTHMHCLQKKRKGMRLKIPEGEKIMGNRVEEKSVVGRITTRGEKKKGYRQLDGPGESV